MRTITVTSLVVLILEIVFIPGKEFCFEPDTLTYLNWAPHRSTGYPLFLDFLSLFSENWKLYSAVQLTLSMLAILYLLKELSYLLKKPWQLFLVWGAFALNPILYTYNVKILSESLFMTLMVVIIALSLASVRSPTHLKYLTGISACVGLSISIRPAGLFYLPALIFFLILLQPKTEGFVKSSFGLFLPCFIVIAISYGIYKAKHGEGSSLIPAHLFGRGLMIMKKEDISLLPPQLQSEVPAIIDLNQKVSGLRGPNIRHLARTRLEVLYQHHLRHQMTDEGRQKVGLELIRTNKMDYFEISLLHFLHLWTGFEIFSQAESESYAAQNKDWGKLDLVTDINWKDVLVKKRQFFPLAWLHWGLLIPFGTIVVIIFYSLYLSIKKTDAPYIRLAGFLSICCLGSSVVTALTGISTLRYTLNLTPFIMMIYVLLVIHHRYRSSVYADEFN